VILNWNGKKFLEKFLPSVISSSPSYAEIIVADNNSSDDSVSFLQQSFPAVRVIKNSFNGGFAQGYNEALKHVEAEYFVLLNSDVEVPGRWIEPVIEMMDRDPLIAAAQPKILSYNKKNFFEYAGAAGGYIDKFGFPFCRGRILEELEEDKGQYNEVKEIFWATGACLFIRSHCFNLAGGFDADFFAHMEEIDLCWRLKNQGYKIMYCPGSHVFHVGAGTLSKTSPHKTFLNFRNNLALLIKNHPPQWFFWKLFVRLMMDGLAGWKFLFAGQFSHLWAVLRAHYRFYMDLRKNLRKRRELKPVVKKYTTSAVYLYSIVFDFYLRGNRTFDRIDKPGRFLWSDKAEDRQPVGIKSEA
jgi:GT2 family glycosyltransferase